MKSNTQKAKIEALKISSETYNIVAERDKGCIICQVGEHYKTKEAREKGMPIIFECHHFISRARLGMGIPENLVILCKYHHQEETLFRDFIKQYLKNYYEGWNEDKLVFKKGII